MPPSEFQNLGTVRAIHIGTIAPTNTAMLWYNINIGEYSHYYYSISDSMWKPLNKSGVNPDLWEAGTGVGSIQAKNITTISASGDLAVATGDSTEATGVSSFVTGIGGKSNGEASFVTGINCIATGQTAQANGLLTIASGNSSRADGIGTTASGESSSARGSDGAASGANSDIQGKGNYATAMQSHATGTYTRARGMSAYSGGNYTLADGENSVSNGLWTQAEGKNSACLLGNYNHVTSSGDDSVIIGGQQNECSHVRSVILGGDSITSNADNTVYVPDLVIKKQNGVPSSSSDPIGEDGSILTDGSYIYYKNSTGWLRVLGIAF